MFVAVVLLVFILLKRYLFQGRLPVDNEAIDKAFEAAVNQCLRSLQRLNPTLLLTSNELRSIERDTLYLPAIGSALASIVCKSRDTERKRENLGIIRSWNNVDKADAGLESDEESGDDSEDSQVEEAQVASSLEARFRLLMQNKKQKGARKKSNKKMSARSQEDDGTVAATQESEYSSYVDLLGDTEDEDSQPVTQTAEPKSSDVAASLDDTDDFDDWLA